MKAAELKKFLVDSNTAGYAGGKTQKWIKERDGSTTIPFKKGKWRSDDNFFGGEPYGGRIIVFYNEKPVWIMVYYGYVLEDQDADEVYEILREALKKMPKDHPFRGPEKLLLKDKKYINVWKGNIGKYSGEEKIYKGNRLIYKANYLGGHVDRRSGV